MDTKTKRRLAVVLLAVIVGLNSFGLVWAKKAKSVTALIDAKWKETPFLLEAAEFLADESPDKFWSYVEEMAAVEPESFLQSECFFYFLALSSFHCQRAAGSE